jgi:site-specific DNA recombinase
MTRAVLYARVSSEDDNREGGRLDDQIKMCRKLAESKGYDIVAELSEDEHGVSGATLIPAMVEKFLLMADNHQFDVLIAREVDRLSRDSYKYQFLTRELKKSGVSIEYALYDFPPGRVGDLMRSMMSNFAQYEREEIAWRLTNGRRRKARELGSVMCHGHPPYGYSLVKPTEKGGAYSLILDKAEAEIVRLVYRWYRDGLSLHKIKKELEQLGIPTKSDKMSGYGSFYRNHTRGTWNISTLSDMIRNENYLGRFSYSPEKIQTQIPAILTLEEWEPVQARIDANIGKENGPRNLKRQYLVRRRAICGDCGCSMVAYTLNIRGRRYPYYKCNCHQAKVHECNSTITYPVDAVDGITWAWLKKTLKDNQSIKDGLQNYRSEQEKQAEPTLQKIAIVEKRLGETQASYQRLLDLYLAGEFNRDILAAKKRDLEKTITDCETSRSELRKTLATQSITAEQERNLMEYAAKISGGMEEGDDDFDTRREQVELADVYVTLDKDESGQKVMRIKCLLGEGFYILSPSVHKFSNVVSTDMWDAAFQSDR